MRKWENRGVLNGLSLQSVSGRAMIFSYLCLADWLPDASWSCLQMETLVNCHWPSQQQERSICSKTSHEASSCDFRQISLNPQSLAFPIYKENWCTLAESLRRLHRMTYGWHLMLIPNTWMALIEGESKEEMEIVNFSYWKRRDSNTSTIKCSFFGNEKRLCSEWIFWEQWPPEFGHWKCSEETTWLTPW